MGNSRAGEIKTARISVLGAACASVAIVFAACNAAEESTGPAVSSTKVKVVPAAAVMRAGDTIRFTATATPNPATGATWTWRSYDATKVAVDSTGLARAIVTYPVGTICASLKTDVNASGCADLVSPAR